MRTRSACLGAPRISVRRLSGRRAKLLDWARFRRPFKPRWSPLCCPAIGRHLRRCASKVHGEVVVVRVRNVSGGPPQFSRGSKRPRCRTKHKEQSVGSRLDACWIGKGNMTRARNHAVVSADDTRAEQVQRGSRPSASGQQKRRDARRTMCTTCCSNVRPTTEACA